MVKLRHDLHRTEDTLVVPIKHTTERGETRETERMAILHEPAPASLAWIGDGDGHVKVTVRSESSGHYSCLQLIGVEELVSGACGARIWTEEMIGFMQ